MTKQRKSEAVPPTVKDDKKDEDYRDYLTKDEREHTDFVKARMETARDARNETHDEFDGLGYLEAYDRDTMNGTAFIAPAVNEGENALSSGTTRQSLMSLLARALSHNFQTEFRPFDKEENLMIELGRGLEIAVEHANYLDNDDDQQKTRINELFTHGDEISYEDWVTKFATVKSRPKFSGKVKGVTWTEKLEKVFEGCERRTVQGRRFYPGDIYTEGMDAQPFAFEVNHITYAEARAKYGKWERWPFVPERDSEGNIIEDDSSSYAEDWSLEDSMEGVEEVLYCDKPNNEMFLSLGGVPMLPMGFPMKWEHDKYPWAHTGAEPIRTGFFYHRSFVRTLQNMQDIENDLWRVLIMLAWRAAMPPVANMTGQVVTRRNLLGGSIIDGVDGDMLKPIFDGDMANTGFLQNVLDRVNQNMTDRSVPEIKQGMTPAASATATAVVQQQKEAEIAISMNLSAAGQTKTKADRLRAGNILQYAFNTGFRATNESPGKGGIVRHIVEVVDELKSSRDLKDMEDGMEEVERKPVRITQVTADAKGMINRLEARSVPKPKTSSAMDKIELNQMFQTAAALFGDRLDPTLFEDLFRAAYQVSSDIPLTRDLEALQSQLGPQGGGGGGGVKPKPVSPNVPANQLGNTTPGA